MITKSYILNNNIACGLALAEIALRIPCFFNFDGYETKNILSFCEVTIQCREADLPFVEKKLADFV